jgi:hypothetical protein
MEIRIFDKEHYKTCSLICHSIRLRALHAFFVANLEFYLNLGVSNLRGPFFCGLCFSNKFVSSSPYLILRQSVFVLCFLIVNRPNVVIRLGIIIIH